MPSRRIPRLYSLHHDQINAGRDRRLQRHADRIHAFLTLREQARWEHRFPLLFGFLCFAYTMLATALYLGRVI